jgi:hypothetical protein
MDFNIIFPPPRLSSLETSQLKILSAKRLCNGADKSLAFPIRSTTKRIFWMG